MTFILPPVTDSNCGRVAAKFLYEAGQAFATAFAKWGGMERAKRVRDFIENENLRAYGGCSQCGDDFYLEVEGYEISWSGENFNAKAPNVDHNFPRFHLAEGEIGLDVLDLWKWLTHYTVEFEPFKTDFLPGLLTALRVNLGATVRFHVEKDDYTKDRIYIRV